MSGHNEHSLLEGYATDGLPCCNWNKMLCFRRQREPGVPDGGQEARNKQQAVR